MDQNFFQPNHLRFFGPYYRQNWSLPYSFILYIAKNPLSANVYQKMIEICKYFFSKNPVTLCSSLDFYYEINSPNIFGFKDVALKEFDMNSIPINLWITSSIYIDVGDMHDKKTLISSIFPQIYRCDIMWLTLIGQNISYKEFLILSSKALWIVLHKVIVKDADGFIVSLEKLFETVVYAVSVTFCPADDDTSVSAKTMKKLLDIPLFLTLQKFRMEDMPEAFDIDTFFLHAKKNKHTDFYLSFDSSISDVHKTRLESIIDEIIEAQNLDYKPPFIHFVGLDDEKYKKMEATYFKYQIDKFCCAANNN